MLLLSKTVLKKPFYPWIDRPKKEEGISCNYMCASLYLISTMELSMDYLGLEYRGLGLHYVGLEYVGLAGGKIPHNLRSGRKKSI